MMNKKNIFIF